MHLPIPSLFPWVGLNEVLFLDILLPSLSLGQTAETPRRQRFQGIGTESERSGAEQRVERTRVTSGDVLSYTATSSPPPSPPPPIRTIAIRTRSVTGSITQPLPSFVRPFDLLVRLPPQVLNAAECTSLFLRFKGDVESKGEDQRKAGDGIIPNQCYRFV